MKSPHELASMLGVTPDLLPVLPELLADIFQLGSWPDRIADLLAGADLPPNSELIELGCGKGAVMIEVAKRLSRRITGVDAFPPFLLEAKREAELAGVDHLCTFVEDDIEAVVRSPGRIYDAVILAAVGALGEDSAETIDKLRRVVRSGGYMVIDDGYLTTADVVPYRGYEYVRDREETQRQLTSHGDRILREVIVPKEDLVANNARNNRVIAERAAQIIARAPELRETVEGFVRAEEEECRFMEAHTEAALFLLQKK